jgi:hypothetical protein
MATPTNLPASFVSGAILTADQMNNLRGAFRILQVVQSTSTSTFPTTSGTYADDGLSISITPQSATNKVLVICSALVASSALAVEGSWQLLRASTQIGVLSGVGYNSAGASNAGYQIMILDSPATTSAVTYKTQAKRDSATGTLFFGANSSTRTLIAMEISA